MWSVLGLVLLSFFAPLPARSSDHSHTPKSYWVDTSGAATLADARQSNFEAHDGPIAKGFSSAALWLKLRIPGQAVDETMAVVVRPAFLKSIELYDPDLRGDSAAPMLSGRSTDTDGNNHIGVENGFVVPSATTDRDIYLRITTTTSLTADVSITTVKDAIRQIEWIHTLLAMYISFTLLVCIWSMANFAIRGDTMYLIFAIRQMYSGLFIIVHFGVFRVLFSGILEASIREVIYYFVTCTIVVAVGYFDSRLLSRYGGSVLLRRLINIMLFTPALSLPWIIFGLPRVGLHINSIVVNIVFVALVIYAYTITIQSNDIQKGLSVYVIRIGFSCIAISIVIPVSMYLGIIAIPISFLSLIIVQSFIATAVLLLILAIGSRHQDMLAQKERVLLQVKGVELQMEIERRIEKERFISMLTHELRNPLSVIQLLSGKELPHAAPVHKAAQDIADVIARVEQSEVEGQIHVEKTAFDAAELLRQTAAERDVAGHVRLDLPAGCQVCTDRVLLRHVFDNLIDNAIKYGRPGSVIHVDMRCEGPKELQGMAVTVANELGSAGEPDPERLFTKYYRNSRAHRHPGSGLGMFLVAGWVHALGGTVTYSKTGGLGAPQEANFTVWLPQ